jgi:hypothetical protein
VTFKFSEKVNFKNHSSCLQNGNPLLNGAPCRSRTLDGFNTSVLQATRISTELSISGAKVSIVNDINYICKMVIQFSMVIPCWSRTPDGVDTSVLQITRISRELSISGENFDFK